MHHTIKQFQPHAKKINEAGGKLYIVGGAVRRFISCETPHDVDFCVTGISVDSFRAMFPEARQQGKQFPVFVIENCEFAMARTERKSGSGYNGFEFNADPLVSIEDDLLRRDSTINSMAIDVLTGEIIDPYNGLSDFNEKILRPTSEAFKEDPVRCLRAARINAEYPEFRMNGLLLHMMHQLKSEMKLITPDHRLSELRKVFASEKPSKYFKRLEQARILDEVFPEVHALIGVPQAHHTDGDAFDHTMRVLDECRKLTNDPVILYAALSHDFGKATTSEEDLPAHHDHETRSVEIIEKITWVPKEWTSYAKAAAYDHMRGHRFAEMKRGNKVALLERIHKSSRGLDGFCKVLLADKPTPETMKTIALMQTTYAKVYSLTGDDLPEGTPKGEEFGKILHQMRAELI